MLPAASCIWLLLFSLAASAETTIHIRTYEDISKIIHIAPEETITINEVTYTVPPPWQGKKLTARVLTYEDFALIPRHWAWQNSKLYLLKSATSALTGMIEKAEEKGISLVVHSAYRSSGYQKNIFTKMMSEGRSFDDVIRYVAPPGYSQHMLGTVVDFYPSNWNFASLEAYTWLKENSQKFGFSETYPEKRAKGTPWEPWHWRYIPTDAGNDGT